MTLREHNYYLRLFRRDMSGQYYSFGCGSILSRTQIYTLRGTKYYTIWYDDSIGSTHVWKIAI